MNFSLVIAKTIEECSSDVLRESSKNLNSERKSTYINQDPLNSTTMGIVSGLTTVHWDEIGGPPLMGPFIRWWNTLKYWRETWWMLLEAMLFSSQKFSIWPNFYQYLMGYVSLSSSRQILISLHDMFFMIFFNCNLVVGFYNVYTIWNYI